MLEHFGPKAFVPNQVWLNPWFRSFTITTLDRVLDKSQEGRPEGCTLQVFLSGTALLERPRDGAGDDPRDEVEQLDLLPASRLPKSLDQSLDGGTQLGRAHEGLG